LIPEAETEKQKPEGHTMTEQNLTADPDDTEGHGMAHGRDDDDTEGHGMAHGRDDDTEGHGMAHGRDEDDTEGH
jgi:hypothetical protein